MIFRIRTIITELLRTVHVPPALRTNLWWRIITRLPPHSVVIALPAREAGYNTPKHANLAFQKVHRLSQVARHYQD